MSQPNDRFPVGPYTPEDFPEVDVTAVQAVMDELSRLQTQTYTGHDPDHLVAAVVTGDGIVSRVSFAGAAASRPLDALERAIVAAVADAHGRMDGAWRTVAAREFSKLAAPQPEPQAFGGIEMAFDPQEGDRRG